MWRSWIRIAPVLLVSVFLYAAGCSKDPLRPDGNSPPETALTYAPVESDTTTFRVHLYWSGSDQDGEVVQFRYAVDQDTAKPVTRWKSTTKHDSIFTFQVDPGNVTGGHVFWVVAVDDRGAADRSPARRYFSIRTLPPSARITRGPANGQATFYNVVYEWTGTDPDGGPYGNPSPPDSFEYILLWTGRAIEEGHPELPAFEPTTYANLINQATGSALLPPHDDWKWTRTALLGHRFTSLPPGTHVFAVRAVDPAGAKDTLLTYSQNIRVFTVQAPPPVPLVPTFTVLSADVLTNWIQTQDSTDAGTVVQAQMLEGNTATVTWSAVPGGAGTPIAGYSSALDDTTGAEWSVIDIHHTGRTLRGLAPGEHPLYIRAVDEAGRTTLVILQIRVIHPAFRDPGTPASFLYVDDFSAPVGDWYSALRGSTNFPPDSTEDAWWTSTILTPLAQEFGYTFEQTDLVYVSSTSILGRTPPTLEELARHRVVIWSVDLNNTISNPTGLWLTLAYHQSELKQYVRGGGTLIVTGFTLSGHTGYFPDIAYGNFTAGMCAGLDPGSTAWNSTYFLRDYMGIDGALGSNAAQRSSGARDFVSARVTAQGTGLGFATADVDTGGTGAKWNPYAFAGSNPDTYLAPGLPKIEGWKLEAALGCNVNESVYRRENPGIPIASPIYTYHGVDKGVLQDLGPSPREDLVLGIATQAHDNGLGDGSVVTPATSSGVTGRMIFLGFPVYYLEDAQAYAVMRAAFAYVNGSPTLGSGAP